MPGFLFLIYVFLISNNFVAASSTGTTAHLKDIFLGRCWDHQTKLIPRPSNEYKNCSVLWSLFSGAFQHKDACNVTLGDYQPYAEAAMDPIPPSQTLFWEGTFDLVHVYSNKGRRKLPVSDMLIGYVADRLTWCGSQAPPGTDYENCPSKGECPAYDAYDAFWGVVSAEYAKASSGDILTVMNGSRVEFPAYVNTSFFAKYELPNLDSRGVTSFKVILIHDIGKPVIESCSNGSMKAMRKDVEKFGFKWECSEDPSELVHILCVDHTETAACRLAKDLQTNTGNQLKHMSLIVIILLLVISYTR